MTSDPFQTPRASPNRAATGQHYGQIQIKAAYAAGWELLKKNFFPWLGISIVGTLLIALSGAMLLIPALIVAPAIVWGITRFQLAAYEDRGDFGQLFEGFSNLGPALVGFLPAFLISVLVSVPGQVLSGVAEEMEPSTTSIALALVGSFISIVVSLVTIRWGFANMFIVEHRMNGVDALRASWRATSGQWLTLFLFYLASFCVMMLGVLALGIGAIPAAGVVYFALVAAYRQLVGPAPA